MVKVFLLPSSDAFIEYRVHDALNLTVVETGSGTGLVCSPVESAL
jgi:hypothetical protein